MPTDEEKYRAREATRLLNEPLLAEALTEIRMDAAIELIETDPSAANIDKIRELQAIAKVCEQIRILLERHVTRGSVRPDETA